METALENSVWVISPEFAGYLIKRGFHWRKLWKRRWVALHGSEIAYMAEEPTAENKDNITITKAQITSATFVDREDIDGHPHGFAIHINDGKSPTWYLRADSTREKKSWLMRLGHVHAIVRWLEEFEKVRVLGVGGTGIVYELLHKTNGQRYAMKEMEIKNKAQMQMAVAEAEMLKEIMENISHPNIMHIEKVFQVGNKFYLVFPLCTGGELYEHVIRRGHFTEQDAAMLMRDLISGLHALHQRDILHLDIKPENILFESMAEDARIKITDFGLSKVFNASNVENRRAPSVDEMAQKLKAFQESGVLQRDRLRGTVGYMSPELILAGISSEATDVWASGVVLFILLSGRPPFQSKSNRDILEKSARGDYSMEGKEWEGVSEEAKDLVRKMLIVDPEKRIKCEEILAHPWLKIADPTPGTAAKAAAGGSSGMVKQGSLHLDSALRALSGHVKDRKIEKLAMSFTRLVSSLQQGKGDRSMASQLMGVDGDNGADDMLGVMNPELKDALISAFNKLGVGGDGVSSNGRFTTEQFLAVMNHFGYGGQGGSGGVALMLMCRFIDRDGDGFISAEDLFTAQALVLQRSEVFVRLVFRVYSESLWYPGRQLNILSLQRANTKTPGKGKAIMEEPSSSVDVVEPPKYITSRHVAAVFEKLGYDPTIGARLFSALCEALHRRQGGGSTVTRQVSECDESAPLSGGIAAAVSNIMSPTRGGILCKSVDVVNGFVVLNAALSAIVGGGNDAPPTPPRPASAPRPPVSNTPPLPPSSPSAHSDTAAEEGVDNSRYRMDVDDFIRYAKLVFL